MNIASPQGSSAMSQDALEGAVKRDDLETDEQRGALPQLSL